MISACKMASAARVVAVIPCFPYARQPDAPYKRSGIARRIASPEKILSYPAVKQQVQLLEEQQQHRRSRSRTKSPVRFATTTNQTALFNGGLFGESGQSSAVISRSGSPPPQNGTNGTTEGQTDKAYTSLGLAKSGYRHWVARSGTLVVNMIMAAGADHVITMDLHDPQFQGFFSVPVDNLYGSPLIVKYIREKIANYKQAVIVSPDAGGAKRAANVAHKLGVDFAMIHKERKYVVNNGNNGSGEQSNSEGKTAAVDFNMMLVGNVRGKECILVDDIADTSNTITRAGTRL